MEKRIVIKNIGKFIIFIMICLVFLICLPLLVIGEKPNSSINSSQFNIAPNNITFNNQNGGGPLVKVYITKTKKIEEVYLEEYVRGVIAAEMPADFGIEALKAQAVAARTYAIDHMEAYGGSKCNEANGADLCDTTHCQAYMTKDERIKLWPQNQAGVYWNKLTDAVKETSGEILTYNGGIVKEPYYFAISSGKTESAVEVFGTDLPYLKSVSSPGEEVAKLYKSLVKLTIGDFISKINSKYPKSGLSSGKIQSQISVKGERTQGGSVKEVLLGGITISGFEFRNVLSLNSSDFTITINKQDIIINCIGYGHGVGMSQWGASAMAKIGKNYKDILTHYYQGVALKKLDY